MTTSRLITKYGFSLSCDKDETTDLTSGEKKHCRRRIRLNWKPGEIDNDKETQAV